ncbi:hypothetical protein LMG26857_03600 [Achromobacter anxifer]|nr:hypothetical protein LMG26857_03600 [Achromobacter anxifer]
MDSLRSMLSNLFNWRKHPSRVFFFALPLFVLGFGSLVLLAGFQWYLNDKPGYAVIVAVAVVVLVVALMPAYRMHRTFARLDAHAATSTSQQQ